MHGMHGLEDRPRVRIIEGVSLQRKDRHEELRD